MKNSVLLLITTLFITTVYSQERRKRDNMPKTEVCEDIIETFAAPHIKTVTAPTMRTVATPAIKTVTAPDIKTVTVPTTNYSIAPTNGKTTYYSPKTLPISFQIQNEEFFSLNFEVQETVR